MNEELLGAARRLLENRAWRDALETYMEIATDAYLETKDLEGMATAAYMVERPEIFRSAMQRAHQQHLATRAPLQAARCAIWIGIDMALRGELGPASGWFSRAKRILDGVADDCVEKGYLLLPELLEEVAKRDWAAAIATASEAVEVAERFDDRDLFALAVHEKGHALVRKGRDPEGFALLDEAMVAATTGELSPIVTGLVYCGVIAYCRDLYDLRRAQEWTAALTHWCEQQPQMVAYTGQCLIHRAEIMQLRGAWPDALQVARQAQERFAETMQATASGQAQYRRGEIDRLRGNFADAEQAYREASRLGWEPQPGLALLRLEQGNAEAAAQSIQRTLAEVRGRLRRAPLLRAGVEIMLEVENIEAARTHGLELKSFADDHESQSALRGMAGEAEGMLHLADGNAAAALVALRGAWQMWEGLDAPYEAARIRVMIGRACRALKDDEAAQLEYQAARQVFERLGAKPDLQRVEGLLEQGGSQVSGPLTARELQVLAMVASGMTNKEIAAELMLSERTVDRHVSNVLTKLGVSTRTAATAYAYEHKLL